LINHQSSRVESQQATSNKQQAAASGDEPRSFVFVQVCVVIFINKGKRRRGEKKERGHIFIFDRK
jgi:hypothetical protein